MTFWATTHGYKLLDFVFLFSSFLSRPDECSSSGTLSQHEVHHIELFCKFKQIVVNRSLSLDRFFNKTFSALVQKYTQLIQFFTLTFSVALRWWILGMRKVVVDDTWWTRPVLNRFQDQKMKLILKQERFTTCFKICGTCSLFRGWGEGAKSLWCQGFADMQTDRTAPRNPFYKHFGCIMWELVGYLGAFWRLH